MLNSKNLQSSLVYCSTVLLLWGVVLVAAHAGELVYTPTNPTFGGNPNNAAGLLAVANAQNDYKAPSATKAPLTALEKFTNSVQAAVLSRLSREAVADIFVDSNGDPILNVPVTAGNFTIEFQKGDNDSLIMITKDNVNGGETRIVVGSTTNE